MIMDYLKFGIQAFGVVANGLTMKLTRRKKILKMSVSRVLFMIALADSGMLCTQMYQNDFIPRFSIETRLGDAFQKAVCWTERSCIFTSYLLVSYVSFERFIAVVHYTRAKRINSLKNARIAMVASSALAILFSSAGRKDPASLPPIY